MKTRSGKTTTRCRGRPRKTPTIPARTARPQKKDELTMGENTHHIVSGRANPRHQVPLRSPRHERVVYIPIQQSRLMVQHRTFSHNMTPVMVKSPCLTTPPFTVRRHYQRTNRLLKRPIFMVEPSNTMSALPVYGQNENWPEDLQDLLEAWDDLPVSQLRETIKWLMSPPMPTILPLPTIVANIQELMAEWDDTYDNKINQILEWLSCCPYDTSQEITSPVIVEAEPTAALYGDQWSSMA